MDLQLVILNKNSESRNIWAKSFHANECANIVATNEEFSVSFDSLDAILMTGQSAHERVGGGPIYGTSQVLPFLVAPRERKKPLPPWIVTIPSLYIDGEDSTSIRNLYYITFSIIFRTIKLFNLSSPSTQIKSLGIDLDYIFVKPQNSLEKAEGVSLAYSDYY